MSGLRKLRSAAPFGAAKAVLALALACSTGGEISPGDRGPGSGLGPSGSAGSMAPGGPGAPGQPGGENLPPADTCVPGVPATTQIPRLLNRQYEAAVRDLLGVTSVGGRTPSQLLVADFDGPMTPDAWRIYQDVGAQIASAVMTGPNRARFIGCDLSETEAGKACRRIEREARQGRLFDAPVRAGQRALFSEEG